MFRRIKAFFSRCVGGEKDEGLRLDKTLVAARRASEERQFTLDVFFVELLQKRLQEEEEIRAAQDRQFTLDEFFMELLQKRLQEEAGEIRVALVVLPTLSWSNILAAGLLHTPS